MRTWLVALTVILFLGMALVAILYWTGPGRFDVQGQVTRHDGTPAADCIVVADLRPLGGTGRVYAIPFIRPMRWETRTDAEGRYELRGLRTDGEVIIFAAIPPDLLSSMPTLRGIAADAVERVDLRLPSRHPSGP